MLIVAGFGVLARVPPDCRWSECDGGGGEQVRALSVALCLRRLH